MHEFLMPSFRFWSLLIAAAAFTAGCSNDAPVVAHHYYHPQWSGDGSVVVAGYQELQGATPAAGGANLVVWNQLTGARVLLAAAGFDATQRFWFEPRGSVVAFADHGLAFIDRNGARLGVLQAVRNIEPSVLSFAKSGSAYFAGGSSGGRLVIARATYSADPSTPDELAVVTDTASTAALIDLEATKNGTVAAYLSDGTVTEYAPEGSVLSRMVVAPLAQPEPWQREAHMYESRTRRRLYVHSDSGVSTIDFDGKSTRLIIKGDVVNMDISDQTNLFAFETRTGDIWIADIDGQPLSRAAAQHLMPSFSPDGKSLASVSRVSAASDTLAILRIVK